MGKHYLGCEQPWGYYAYVEHGFLVIGENYPHEGGDLYSGEYRGDDTPYMTTLKKDAPRIYNKIVKYFEEHKDDTAPELLTPMERLQKVFDKYNWRNMPTDLYHCIRAVLDPDKDAEVVELFKKYHRELVYKEK